jgi:hypothetical protein
MTEASSAIARLRELRAKATAGRWCAPDASEGDVWAVTVNGEPFIPLMRSERGNYKSWGKSLTNDERKANAAAIVAAMNSLDALLECAEAVQKIHDHLSDYIDARKTVDVSVAVAFETSRAALQALAGGGE